MWDKYKIWLAEYLMNSTVTKPVITAKAGETWYMKTWRNGDIEKRKIIYISDNLVVLVPKTSHIKEEVVSVDKAVFIEKADD